jgi:putative colanic acid biosynthesis UDP-glucose lipid carrier transferase
MLNLSLPSLNEQAVFSESYSAQTSHFAVTTPKYSLKKRLFDIVIASLAIVSVLIWFIPLVGLVIRLTSPGPVFFIQLRTGRNGRPFRCLKFRTMTYERNAEFRQATKNDTRVTKIGQFLRKTNLDELPQVFNVLLGTMSIVGPRPHPIQLDAQHWHTLPLYPSRYAVKPGITGLAQVRGHRGETARLIDMEHRVRLDRLYIQKRTLLLDMRICWWTFTSMVKGDKKAF